ncbi:hypothetical protein [Actinoalloteichus fjordicus]|uniref:hypothetical protein n=1 Tax=Actinoalloteichus fjordicus TaxID=1612552 RepID=UPI0012F83EE5|nr:hypothetical protein [Actinoalloteichus fjordicus]
MWLELGHEDFSGQAHILKPSRVEQFEKGGISREDITDLVFSCLEREKCVGHHKDAEVYEFERDGEIRRIAILVGSNGYLVTAYFFGRKRKLSREF